MGTSGHPPPTPGPRSGWLQALGSCAVTFFPLLGLETAVFPFGPQLEDRGPWSLSSEASHMFLLLPQTSPQNMSYWAQEQTHAQQLYKWGWGRQF